MNEIINSLYLLKIAVCASVLWIGYCFFRSIYDAHKEYNNLGEWVEDKYVFSEEKLVKTINILPKDNGKIIPLEFPLCNKNWLVGFRVTFNGGIAKLYLSNNYSKIGTIDPASAAGWVSRDACSGSFIYDGRAEAIIYCPNNSDMTTARIYQTFMEKR